MGAPRDVQASLYRLIFERTIGNGHMLPDSTIIASASNYKENLPVMCDITSPNLNRFCIVNLEPTDFESLYTEFLQEPQDLKKDLPEFQNNELTPEMMQKTAQEVRRVFDGLNDALRRRCTGRLPTACRRQCRCLKNTSSGIRKTVRDRTDY